MSMMDGVAEISFQTAVNSQPWLPQDDINPKAVYFDKLPAYEYMFQTILLKNQLCVIGPAATDNWPSRQLWVTNTGKPDFKYIKDNYGEASAPVADCSQEEFCSHPKSQMKVEEFIKYWQDFSEKKNQTEEKCLYLKDWHFTRDFPECSMYLPPAFLCSDWLNEFCDTGGDKNCSDDYKFVYMGPSSSWTPFHADVLHSYSWSANICGRKKWIFYPPGAEENLRDRHGQLIFDLRSLESDEAQKFLNASKCQDAAITVIQEPGEIIFVPSGWHHQVFNLEDTISINHNWINGCGAHLSWRFLKSRLAAVQREIEDCRAMDDWHLHCQVILNSDSGIDYRGFFNLLYVIAKHRLHSLCHDCQPKLKIFLQNSGVHEKSALNSSLPKVKCKENDSVCKNEGCYSKQIDESTMAEHEHFAHDIKQITEVEPYLLGNIFTFEHSILPHWAHCGSNLAIFDLQQVKVIICDMLEQPEFEAVLPQLTCDPSKLLSSIDELLHTASYTR